MFVHSTTHRAAVAAKLLRPHDVAPRRDTHERGALIWPEAYDARKRAGYAADRKAASKIPDPPPWKLRLGDDYGEGANVLNKDWLDKHGLPELPKTPEPGAGSSTMVAAQKRPAQLEVQLRGLSLTPSPQRSPAKTPSPEGKGKSKAPHSPQSDWPDSSSWTGDELRSDRSD